MATFTSNFSSWSGFEALLTEAQTFESSPTYASIQSDLVELQTTLFYAEPNIASATNTSITAYYPDGITAVISGTNLLGTNPVITRANVSNGTYNLVMAGSIGISGTNPVGAITSIGFSGQGYAELHVGRMPLDGSAIVFTSWSSTLPTDLGSVSFASTGTNTIDPSGSQTITYSTIAISDSSGHTASISGLNHTVTDGSVDYVELLHELLAGNDVANGGAGDNELYTFAGNDTLDGKAGADLMVGGVGNDTYYVDDVGDSVVETDNDPASGPELARGLDLGDTIDKVVASINYILPDYVEDLTLAGSALSGTGNQLDNILTGNAAANMLYGNDGDDILNGATGADTLVGGLGNDSYVIDNTGDAITEYEDGGVDSVESSVNYTLAAHLESLALTGAAAINATGNEQDNALTGNAAANVLNGGGGADTMSGGNGADTYVVDNEGDIVSESNALAAGGSDLVQSAISYELGANLERLTLTGSAAIDGTGNSVANIITGNNGNNLLDGGGGIDTLIGGAGDDNYRVDLTASGSLQDTLTEATGAGTDSVLLRGSLSLANAATLTLAATLENLDASATGSTKLNLTGNAAANILTGNAADNILDGAGGADGLIGGLGNDTYVVDHAADNITENDGEGTDLAKSSISHALADNVENLILTGAAHSAGSGNALANSITGNGGHNTLDGGDGVDTLAGGAGNDTYVVDLTEFGDLQDILIEAAGAGTDTLQLRGSVVLATAATVALAPTLENLDAGATGDTKLKLIGNAAANILTGNAADNLLDGGGGADTLDGGTGADTLSGGDGNDTYVVDNAGDLVSETSALAAGGVDLVLSSVSHTLSDNLERLTLTGTAAINGTGNALANMITGNSGNNTLNGGGGNDTLVGGTGNDLYVIDSLSDVVSELADGGSDHVLVNTALATGTFVMAANIEYGTLGGVEDYNLSGNASDNWMYGNNGANILDGGSGNDSLHGGAGNDILRGGNGDDMFDGEAGSDTMEGGAGNDTYYVNRGDGAGTATTSSEDRVVELAGGGTDTVCSRTYTYTLDANVENLVLEYGNTARKGIGNALDNAMTGNDLNNTLSGEGGNDELAGGAGNDTLNGGNGNDLLDGGLGKDVLNGGAGNDTFVFATAPDAVTNNDRIADFSSGLDTIRLSNSVFTALGPAGALDAGFFHLGASAGDGDDHVIFNVATGALYYDADGDGAIAQVQFATLAAGSALAGTDFLIGI